VFLLRHGQSEFNVHFSRTRVDPGIEDPHITDLGRAQAEAAATHLAGTGIRRVVASPYRRALQTAQIVADRLQVAIEVEPLVRERCWFACDIGTPVSRLRTDWPHVDFGDLPERWWPEDGESETDLARRCDAFTGKLRHADTWADAVFVSHWAFIRGLTGHAVPNGTVVALDRPGSDGGLAATIVHTSQS
jgi:broad specificity phosphatase PhoE